MAGLPVSRLVAGGAIREDSPDSRRFVFPTKNARAPIERDQHISIEVRRLDFAREVQISELFNRWRFGYELDACRRYISSAEGPYAPGMGTPSWRR